MISLGRNIESAIGDYWMNTNTSGPVHFSEARGVNKDAFDFQPNAHSTVLKAIKLANLAPADVVFVLGSGKGRAVCHFARQQVKKVYGIELSKELCEIAKKNVESLRNRHAEVEIINNDTALVDLHEGTVFYMFNPFGEQTSRTFLKNIDSTHNTKTTPVTIIYVNPLYDYVFKEFPWLRLVYSYTRLSGMSVKIFKN